MQKQMVALGIMMVFCGICNANVTVSTIGDFDDFTYEGVIDNPPRTDVAWQMAQVGHPENPYKQFDMSNENWDLSYSHIYEIAEGAEILSATLTLSVVLRSEHDKSAPFVIGYESPFAFYEGAPIDYVDLSLYPEWQTRNIGQPTTFVIDLADVRMKTIWTEYGQRIENQNLLPSLLSGHFNFAGLSDHGVNYSELRIEIAPIPAPGALMLGGIGVGLVTWLRRRRAL